MVVLTIVTRIFRLLKKIEFLRQFILITAICNRRKTFRIETLPLRQVVFLTVLGEISVTKSGFSEALT